MNESVRPIWPLARLIKQKMKDGVHTGRDSAVSVLGLLRDYDAYFKGLLGKKREESFEVSNLGAWREDVDEAEGWRVTRAVFSQCASVTGAAVAVSVISVAGELGFCVQWMEGVVEEKLGKGVVKGLKEELEGLAGITKVN